MKETPDIDILVTSSSGDRKLMQSIRITSRPHSRIRKWNQFSQLRWTPTIITKSQSIISIVLQVYLAIKVTQWQFADLISFIVPSPVKKLVTNSMNMFLKVLIAIFLLFCFMFKKEHKEKKNLFYFESFFSSWDNKILNFQAFICYDIIKCLSMKHKTYFTG